MNECSHELNNLRRRTRRNEYRYDLYQYRYELHLLPPPHENDKVMTFDNIHPKNERTNIDESNTTHEYRDGTVG
jgi:hypothetical protein